jgi:ferredoxin-NADP reductase
MRVVRTAVVMKTQQAGPLAHWLELEMHEPLGFVGGQFISVESGLPLPDGKISRRAYSAVSSDAEQGRFELVVKPIPGGLTSDFMRRLKPGDEVRFTGPWGTFAAPAAPPGSCLVIATDTGITAALGLLRGVGFRGLLPSTVLLWLRVDAADFVSDEFVRQRLPETCREFQIHSFPPIHHPERLPIARSLLRQVCSTHAPSHARVCGDGVINYGLMADFAAHGIDVTPDDVESFFNLPAKSR